MKFKRPKILSYEETIRFHGHNGPFLALGYRLGRYLNKKLRPKGVMSLNITVKTKLGKPFTCIVDGLQCSTLATMGKGTMLVNKSRGNDIKVFVTKGKQKYTYKITKQAIEICLTAEDLNKAAKKIFKMTSKNLWKMIQ